MATPLNHSPDPIVSRRHGPRHRISTEVLGEGSDCLREFRSHTAGLSNRLPLRSLESMRAGAVMNPHTLARRYLMAARRIGLSREWAQRFLVWLGHTVDSVWPMEATPLPELERRAMSQENADNLAELAYHAAPCRETLQSRRDTLAREIAADQLLLAKYDREIEAAQ